MAIRRVLFVILLPFLTVPILGSNDNSVYFKVLVSESGVLNLNIRLSWEPDPTIAAFKVYSVPSKTLLWCTMNPNLDTSAFKKMFNLKSHAKSVGILNAAVQLDNYQIEGDTGYVLSKVAVKDLSEEQLLNFQVGNYTGPFDFKVTFTEEAGGTGCFTSGQCGDGDTITGPYCDPCNFRLCCNSNPPFIDCDYLVLCP